MKHSIFAAIGRCTLVLFGLLIVACSNKMDSKLQVGEVPKIALVISTNGVGTGSIQEIRLTITNRGNTDITVLDIEGHFWGKVFITTSNSTAVLMHKVVHHHIAMGASFVPRKANLKPGESIGYELKLEEEFVDFTLGTVSQSWRDVVRNSEFYEVHCEMDVGGKTLKSNSLRFGTTK